MAYEINIAKKDETGMYHHYFATAKRSISSLLRLKKMVADFTERFPAPEFNISVSYSPEVSHRMGVEEFIKNPEKLNEKKLNDCNLLK